MELSKVKNTKVENTKAKKIDINCDLGEGMKNDAQIMPYLDSCNIACCGHFGTHKTIVEAIRLAQKQGVKVGAHPSFPDRENFGRKIMAISRKELTDSLYQQIQSFKQACDELGVQMHHIKLHGALYNLVTHDTEIAALCLNVFAATSPDITIYVPDGSVISMLAEDYFPLCFEAFIDRQYHKDLSLVSRGKEGAVIKDIKKAWEQMQMLIEQGQVKTREGEFIAIKADTFCLHGDEDNALDLIEYIRQCLKA